MRRGGFKALTVRAVAAQAQANLGSFVYHFGSRAAFVDELIERWYAPLFAQLQLSASDGVAAADPDPGIAFAARDDPLHQMMFVMTTLAVPVLVFHLLGQRGMAPRSMLRALSALSTDPAQIQTRLDWALRGLAP